MLLKMRLKKLGPGKISGLYIERIIYFGQLILFGANFLGVEMLYI